jgi:hypothetical protein
MKIICSRMRRGSALLCVLLLLPWASGCGDKAKGVVSGKVTYQGKPLANGTVTFVPEEGAPQHAEIKSDGTYRMTHAPMGLVKIGVESRASQESSAPKKMPRNPEDYGKLEKAMTGKDSLIPEKYADPNQSGLTFTVKKGQQKHDIDLE